MCAHAAVFALLHRPPRQNDSLVTRPNLIAPNYPVDLARRDGIAIKLPMSPKELRIRVVPAIRDVPSAAWDACANPGEAAPTSDGPPLAADRSLYSSGRSPVAGEPCCIRRGRGAHAFVCGP